MTIRFRAIRVATGLMAVAIVIASATAEAEGQRPSLDAVLDAYAKGDVGAVAHAFAQSRDFHARLRPTDDAGLGRWLGVWDRRKAVLLIEIAGAATTAAPQYVRPVLWAGLRYANQAPDDAGTAAFRALWYRAAIAILEGFGQVAFIEEFAESAGALVAERDGETGRRDSRAVLARAIAQEQRCWRLRPDVEQPGDSTNEVAQAAGMPVRADADAPSRSVREARAEAHRTCLREAVTRYEAVMTSADTRDEARVRGGWVLFQDGRFEDALQWLRAAAPAGDPEAAYWRDLFLGRVLDSLGRRDEAVAAYRAALGRFPGARAAGVAHAVALLRLDRDAEADAAARAVRAHPDARDPWRTYLAGDLRWLPRWIDELREAMQ